MDIQNEKHAVKLYFFLKKLELIEHISINIGLSEFIYFVKNTVADEIRRRQANTQVLKPGWNISFSKPESNIEVTPAELFTLVVLNNKSIFNKLISFQHTNNENYLNKSTTTTSQPSQVHFFSHQSRICLQIRTTRHRS